MSLNSCRSGRFRSALLALLTCGVAALRGQTLQVTSPDKTLQLQFQTDPQGRLTYSFAADGKTLITPSPLGFGGGTLGPSSCRAVDSLWKPVWGKRAVVPERFNEIAIDLKTWRLVARVYDDGLAFRSFNLLAPSEAELTEFNFAGDYTAWYYNGERHNLGPEKLSECQGRRLPVVTIQAHEQAFLAIHEADLANGQDPLVLKGEKGTTRLAVASQASSAWRVVLFGRAPGSLVDSHLIELLAPEPAKGLDFSWVNPGVAVWDWRINGAKVDGFEYRMSLPSWKRMVDFAAEHQIGYLVLDADWYGPEFHQNSDPTKGGKVQEVRDILAYGKTRNVGVWLYLNDIGGRRFPLEETLKQYSQWGAVGIKYGFMRGTPVEKNIRTQRITELCAENHLLCDFHDSPVHPFGQMRTWPNAVTREYCESQLDAHRVFWPKTFVTSVFVNMLAGPLDMNNGLADLLQADRVDQRGPVPSTLVGEAARTLIVFSGATVIPDIPENYRKHPELIQFIAAEKQPWRQSLTLSGIIGEQIVMARQAADGRWLVGAATNEEARELEIPLKFLPPGRYEALVLQDGADADYRTHQESYQSQKRTVQSSENIRVKLAPGGGACLLIKPLDLAQSPSTPKP